MSEYIHVEQADGTRFPMHARYYVVEGHALLRCAAGGKAPAHPAWRARCP